MDNKSLSWKLLPKEVDLTGKLRLARKKTYANFITKRALQKGVL